MLKPVYSKRFDRDVRKMLKRGNDPEKLKDVVCMLVSQEKLDKKYQNHPMKGDYKGCYDCHIEPDWILIYRIEGETIQFVRTGSHADLFK